MSFKCADILEKYFQAPLFMSNPHHDCFMLFLRVVSACPIIITILNFRRYLLISQFALRYHANSRVDFCMRVTTKQDIKNPVLEAELDQKCPSSMLYIVL